MNDPVTEAIAASGYLTQANQAMQNAGVTNPTVLDARSYYNFGPATGVQIAQASGRNLMSQYVSPSVLAANGISAHETVGQWQGSVSSRIGNASNQTVLM